MAETRTLQEILVTLGDKPLNLNVSIPGMKGENGQDGRNGADGLSAYDIAQLNGFTGTQQQWLDSLKAGAVADEARTMLLNGNVWCKSNSIADVLAAVISNLGKAFPRTEFKPLTVHNVLKGQRVAAVEGEPHYFVKVAGMETQFEIGDDGVGSISIAPLGADDVSLTYHNFTGAKVGEATIQGDTTGEQTPDEEYRENGILYKRYGNTLKMNITGNTVNGNFKDNPKNWNVTLKVIYATMPSTLNLRDTYNNPNYGPYFVETPENVTFKASNGNMELTVATITQVEKTIPFTYNVIEWDKNKNSYINTGYYNDTL